MKKTRLSGINNIYQGYKLYNDSLQNYQGDYYYDVLLEKLKSQPDADTSIWEDIASIGSSVGDVVTTDIPNALRGIADRWVDGKISASRSNRLKLQSENEDLLKVLDYYDLLDLYLNESDPEKKSQLRQNIKEFDDYFLGEGRKHPVIAQLMFDKKLLPDSLKSSYTYDELKLFATSDNSKEKHSLSSKNTLLQNLGEELSFLSDTALNTLSSAWNWLYGYLNGVTGNDKYVTNRAIMSSGDNDYISKYLQHMYVGGINKTVDGLEYSNVSNDNRNALNSWKNYNNQKDKELTYEIKANTWAKRYGTAKLPFSQHLTKLWGDERGMWFDVWDPEDVSPEWKKAQEEHSGEFWHPLYMLPELGSTLGLFAGSLETMGVNGVSEYIIRKLPVWANNLIGTGKGKAIGEWGLKHLPYLQAGIRSAEISTSFNILAAQREKETAQESDEAVTTKLMKTAFDAGADGQSVFSNIINYAENNLGIDTSSMEPKDLISLALAFDINTGDKVFEDSKKSVLNGLVKLENANNALALHDYLEMIPWLGYGGNVMSKFSKMLATPLKGKYVPIRPTGGWLLSPNKLWNDISNNYRNGVYTNAIHQLHPELSLQYFEAMEIAKNSVIDNIAKRFIERDLKKLGLFTQHAGEYASSLIKRSIPTMIVEGFEEGLQQTLQQRYANGDYEGYSNPYSIFNIPEAFKNLELAKHSYEALFGLHGEGDDEIRKAMAIGAFISPIMGIGMNAVTNFSQNENNQNLRNLLGQLRTDNVLGNMISHKYQEDGDTEHLSLFYDAFRKTGVTGFRLAKALNDLKGNVDTRNSLVEPDYIDRDVKLMLAAWSLYNNDQFAKDAEKEGIPKYSDDYKEMIIQSSRAIVDAQQSGVDLINKLSEIHTISSNLRDDLSRYLNDATPQEIKDQILESRPELLALITTFDDYYAKYTDILSKWNSQTISKRKTSFENMPVEDLAKSMYDNEKTWYQKYSEDTGTDGRQLSSDEIVELLKTNSEEYDNFIEYLANKGLGINTKELIYSQLLDAYETMLRLDVAKTHRGLLSDRLKTLSDFRKLTGKDVDLSKIEGYIDTYNELVDMYQKQADSILKRRNGVVDLINRTQDSDNSLLLTPTLEDFFSGSMNIKTGNEDELKKAYGEMMLLQSVNTQQTLLANVILHRDQYGPEEIKNAIVGRTGSSELFDQLISDYKNEIKESSERDELDQKEDEIDSLEKLRNIRKKAAWNYIINEIKEKSRRKYITHKNILDEAGLTEETAQDTNEASEEPEVQEEPVVVIDEQEEPQLEQESQPEEPETQESPREEPQVEEEPEIVQLLTNGALVESSELNSSNTQLSEEESSEEVESEEEPQIEEPEVIEPEITEPEIVEPLDKDDNDYQLASEPLVDENEESSVIEEPTGEPQNISEPDVPILQVYDEPVVNDEPVVDLQIDNNVAAELSQDISLNDLDIINGKWMQKDHEIDDYIMNTIISVQSLMIMLDSGIRAMAYEMPGRNLDRKNAQTLYDVTVSDMLSTTFWYNPDPIDENGNPLDNPIKLTIDGKQIKLKYDLKSGRQLAKKLIQKEWFQNVNKYYVVTQSEEARQYFERHKDINPTPDLIADTLTVSLILEDDSDKSCYACSLRQLGVYKGLMKSINRLTSEPIIDPKTGNLVYEEIEINREEQERKRYETAGIRLAGESSDSAISRIEEEASKILQALYYIATGKEIDINTAKKYILGTYVARKSASENLDEFEARQRDLRSLVLQARNTARQHLLIPGKKILSYTDIDNMISKLRKNRNAIINAYMLKDKKGNYVFPKTVLRTVKPDPNSTNISNGKFANIKTSSNVPVLTTISREGNPFGIPTSVLDISTQIQNGTLHIGYGTGKIRANTPYHILDLRNESILYENGGVAGKIFITVDTVNETSVPLMLIEQKFNVQHTKNGSEYYIDERNLKLAIDPFSGEITSLTHLPSSAEAILYMLFGKLNSLYIPGNKLFSSEVLKQFAELIVNNGQSTLLKNEKVEDKLPYYAAKQLAVIDGRLEIGMKLYNEDGSVVYRRKSYTQDELFSDTEASVQLRTAVVSAIASQMHWNTEKIVMNNKFGGPETDLIIKALRKYFTDNKTEQSFSIAGIPEFTFNKSDLFQLDKNGSPIRVLPNTLVVAWMIKTGRILTDVGNDIFYAPYVYASGLETTTPTSDASAIVENLNSQLINIEELLSNMSSIETLNNRIKEFGDIYKTLTEYENLVTQVDRSRNSAKYLKYGARVRSIMLDMSKEQDSKFNDVDQFELAIINRAEKLIEELNKTKSQLKLKDNADLKLDTNIKNIVLLEDALNVALGKKGRHAVPVINVYESGHVEITLYAYNGIGGIAQQYVSGVYSTEAQLGLFDENFARKWLLDTLGIKSHQVVVTDAVLRSIDNRDVFGLMEVIYDSITEQDLANFKFRRSSGRGIQFHEAWHYVNLLIHNSSQRKQLYKEYVKYNSSAKGKTFREIEEMMAEDYRVWSENKLDHPTSSKIKEFFRNVGEFLHIISNRPAYEKVYKNIHSGMYKNAHLDADSVSQFKRRYNGQVTSIDIPGVSAESTKDFVSVLDFYDVGNAIVDYAMQMYHIDRIESLKKLVSKRGFSQFKSMLLDLADELEDSKAVLVRTFVENPDSLLHMLSLRFKDLGVSVNYNEELKIKEETGENLFDRYQFTVSKKENAGYLAKLFIRQIPSSYWDYGKNGTPVFQLEYNKVLPQVVKFVPFDEAWNLITKSVGECNSYADLLLDENGNPIMDDDGNVVYDPNSIRGIVKRLAQSNSFFEAVDRKLSEIDDDSDLSSQLYATINSHTPNMSSISIMTLMRTVNALSLIDPASALDLPAEELQRMQRERDAAFISERQKDWILQNDNTLRAARNIPRKWSQSILMQGLVDRGSENQVISDAYAKSLTRDRNKIISKIESVLKLKKIDSIQNIKSSIIQLLNKMGISCDMPTLDFFIQLDFEKSGEVFSNSTILKHLKNILKSNQAGSIGYFISLINRNVGKSSYVLSVTGTNLKNEADIDKTFVGTKLTSTITKLALAYNAIHPSSEEYGVRLPNGEMGYPNSQNSTVSTEYRLLNTTNGQRAIEKMKSPYAKHSIVLLQASEFDESTPESVKFKLNLNTGLETDVEQEGKDYFGITALEDYLINMFLLDQDPTIGLSDKVKYNNEYTHLIMPTMADKKTHFDILSKTLKTVHDCVLGGITSDILTRYIETNYPFEIDPTLSEAENNKNLNLHKAEIKAQLAETNFKDVVADPTLNYKRFDNNSLMIFVGYFLDELDSLIQYYDKNNIKELIDHPSRLIKNFHGKVKNGRLDFSGNGGLFRYFYDIFSIDHENRMNLNQRLEYLYKLLQKIEFGSVTDENGEAVGLNDIDPSLNMSNVDSADGFELIRSWLEELKRALFDENGDPKLILLDKINNKLIRQTEYELRDICSNPNRLLGQYNTSTGLFEPVAVPALLLRRQNQRFIDKKHPLAKKDYVPYKVKSGYHDALMFYSLVANHVANTAISIIEYEKVNSGDPAGFKYLYISKKTNPDNIEESSFKITLTLQNGKKISQEISVKNLSEKDSDKTKRLGSQLSPGDEIRTGYTKKEIEDDDDRNYLNSNKYSSLTIKDFIAKSEVLESEIVPRFETQLFVDYIRINKLKEIEDLLNDRIKLYGKNNYDRERFIQDIYTNNHKTKDIVKEIFQKSGVYDEFVVPNLKSQKGPYGEINVSDAQTILRPAMYRKIRKGLGLWNDDCEEAYNILETNGNWMNDPELAAKVSKLELYPLKLSYYNNDSRELSPNNTLNILVLNKQACFPLFKFQAQSDTGRALYKRMNMPGNELDMISFESAVKVGAPQNAPSAYGKIVVEPTKLADWINQESSQHIDYDKNEVFENVNDNVIPVTILDIRFLRYLLNTQSHDADSRNIGTLVFKIMYLNLYDNAQYGGNQNYIEQQSGKNIKSDIIGCINALTLKGIDEIQNELYFLDKNSGRMIPSDKSIDEFVLSIVKNQGLGITAEDVILNGGIAESLTQRTVFEQAVSSYINKHVIGIKTHGGTAIQQSIFGFVDYTDKHVGWSEDLFRNFNDGKELRWHRDNGTIEVMLSVNFFKHVVPSSVGKDYKSIRDWLESNNIIGENGKPFGIAYRIPTQGLSSAFAITVADILPENVGDLIVLPREITGLTGSDYDIDKIFLSTLSYEDGELVKIEGELDKNASVKQKSEFYKNQNEKAIQNRLLFDYLSILQDDKSYSLGRKSIDVIVSKLKTDVVRKIDPAITDYRTGMYELLPSFQSDRKLEFKTGKDGIGPFALNITNLTLTQAVHLTMNYDDVAKEYNFGDLDEIQSLDGSYIADWLSAMVSAHVDVAKDPYIFKINVNKVTYNHTAFLLRAGKGISTFSFLAQPILKKYANVVMLAGGLYGRYITGYETTNEANSKKILKLKNGIIKDYINQIENLISQLGDDVEFKELQEIKTGLLKYKYDSASYKERSGISKKRPKYTMNRASIFNFNEGMSHIQTLNNENANTVDKIKALFYLLNCMEAFQEIDKYATELSNLVQVSQIDTEKFGSTIPLLENFKNRINEIKYSAKSTWIIKGVSPELNEIPGFAMKKYFEDSFLQIKFDTATKLMKQLLRRQLLTATELFLDIFSDAAMLINGLMSYNIPIYEKDLKTGKYYPKFTINLKTGRKIYHFDTIKTFKPFHNDDTITKLSQAIDNIARFNILFNSAKVFEKQMNQLLLPENSDRIGTPVDLSFGGDFYKMIRKVSSLILGNKDVQSLPIRVYDFILYITKNPNSEKAAGLVQDGKIINDLLLYLYPIAKSKNSNLDRLLLNESIIRTADYKKEKLIVDFGVLLNHQNEEVRELAKDLVIYSYYTSYDTTGRNQFFSLVPSYYRSGYDAAIKSALRSSSKNDLTDLLKSPIGFTPEQDLSEYYLDIISRNYWYDDNIVKSIFLPNKNKLSVSDSGNIEFRPAEFNWTDPKTKQKFPGLNITTNVLNEPLFVKIKKRGTSVLYKRVGRINVKFTDKTGKQNTLNHATIYMAVQKAGTIVNGTRFYEFFKAYNIPSIYKDNMLPAQFNQDKMWNYVYNMIESYNKALNGNKKGFFTLSLDRSTPDLNLSDENRNIYNMSVYRGYNEDIKQKPASALNGSIRVFPNKKSISYVTNSSDFIINVGEPLNGKKDRIPEKSLIDLKSAFNEDGNINVESVISDINEFTNNLSDFNKERKNILSFNFDETLIPVSEEEKEEYVERNIQFIKDSSDVTDEQLTEYEEMFKEYAEELIKLIKMYQLADISIKSLISFGVKIELVRASKMTVSSRAALTAAYNNRNIIGDPGTELATKGLLYLSNSDIRSEEYETYLSTIDGGINAFVYDIDEEVITEEDEAKQEFNDLIDDALNVLEKNADKKRSDILKDTEDKSEKVKRAIEEYDAVETDDILIDIDDIEFDKDDVLSDILNESSETSTHEDC